MEVGYYGPYSRLADSLDDEESSPLGTLIKSIAMGRFPTYKEAKASEYLVITGPVIDDIKIAKKSWIFAGQSSKILDISPVDYTFYVQVESADKQPFILSAVFTIGPGIEDKECLYKYAKLTTFLEKDSTHMHQLLKGIIEGETRASAASITIKELFRITREFKREVFEKVQLELNQFGLRIYNYIAYLGHNWKLPKVETGSELRDGKTQQIVA